MVIASGYSYYSPKISDLFAGWVCVYVITVIFIILLLFVQYNDGNFYGFWVALAVMHIVCFCFGAYLNERRIRNLVNKYSFETPQELDQYLHYCSNVFVENKYPSPFPNDYFESILVLHRKKCANPSCPLIKRDAEQTVFVVKAAKIMDFMIKYKVSDSNHIKRAEKQIQENSDQQRVSDLKWKRLFLLHISDSHKRIFDTPFMIQQSTIILRLTKNVHRSYLRLAEAESLETELSLAFPMHCKRLDLNKEIEAQLSTLKGRGVPVYSEVLQLEALLKKLERAVKRNATKREKFWNALMSEKADMNVVHSIGQEIMMQVNGILKIWDNMKSIYPSQKDALMLYSQFLYYILAEKREALALQSELDITAQAHLKKWAVGKHSIFADSAAVMVISGSISALICS